MRLRLLHDLLHEEDGAEGGRLEVALERGLDHAHETVQHRYHVVHMVLVVEEPLLLEVVKLCGNLRDRILALAAQPAQVVPELVVVVVGER